jgi:tRNA-Thr(GGU) m(6)t(6)A37 methyltransferase TsaA
MIQFAPIGFVHNAMHQAHRDTPWDTIVSEIEIEPRWREMLVGIADFSHLWVVFYLDRVTLPDSPFAHPCGSPDVTVGRFATRTPSRPNPIGIRAVELLDVCAGRLRVRGLDALDGTPVLDLKPYIERGDAILNTRAPAWVARYTSDVRRA